MSAFRNYIYLGNNYFIPYNQENPFSLINSTIILATITLLRVQLPDFCAKTSKNIVKTRNNDNFNLDQSPFFLSVSRRVSIAAVFISDN